MSPVVPHSLDGNLGDPVAGRFKFMPERGRNIQLSGQDYPVTVFRGKFRCCNLGRLFPPHTKLEADRSLAPLCNHRRYDLRMQLDPAKPDLCYRIGCRNGSASQFGYDRDQLFYSCLTMLPQPVGIIGDDTIQPGESLPLLCKLGIQVILWNLVVNYYIIRIFTVESKPANRF